MAWQPVNRINKYLQVVNMTQQAKQPPVKQQKPPTALEIARLVRDAINKRWRNSDRELAQLAQISVETMSKLVTKGTVSESTIRAVCRCIGVDPDPLIQFGKLVYFDDAEGETALALTDARIALDSEFRREVIEYLQEKVEQIKRREARKLAR